MSIAVVVPTVRDKQWEVFTEKWKDIFDEHNVHLVKVRDGDKPAITHTAERVEYKISLEKYAGSYADILFNKTDAVRNFGLAYAYKEIGADMIISFDDDVYPWGDTIADHEAVLNRRVSISWVNTANEQYVRGFPYGVRNEADVWVSHGVWKGVPDLDAPTQLVVGTPALTFPQQVIPKGVLFPFCAMNFAVVRDAVPYIYQAPMGHRVGLDRFADIWGGVEMKKDLDRLGKAVVSGYASVYHSRLSDVFVNLAKEAEGIGMHEKYGEHPYFKMFHEKRERWKEWLTK